MDATLIAAGGAHWVQFNEQELLVEAIREIVDAAPPLRPFSDEH